MKKSVKYNKTKVSFDSVNPLFEAEVAKVMHYGEVKYDKFNYTQPGLGMGDYYSAARRHLLKLALGEWIDEESGCSHVAHVAACMGMLYTAVAMGHIKPEKGVFEPLAGSDHHSVLALDPKVVEYLREVREENFKAALERVVGEDRELLDKLADYDNSRSDELKDLKDKN